MGLQKNKEFLEGGFNGFPEIDCLEVMLILVLCHFYVLLFAIEPTETCLGDFAVMICRLSTHNTVSISGSIFFND